MKNICILIVEDDNDINNLLKEVLKPEGYNIIQAFSGTEGKLYIENEKIDLVILDLMLPGMSGEKLIDRIREEYLMPVIVISAKIDKEVKVNLLKSGADDFIEKPFDNDEVIARVGAQLRRYIEFGKVSNDENILEVKNLKLIKDEMKVLVKNEEIKLTSKEYEILLLLLSNPKKVFTKSNLYQSIWEEEYYNDDNTLNVHISNIRNKIIEKDGDNQYIETVWGIGYKLKS